MKDYTAQWFEIYRRHKEPADIQFTIENNNRTELISIPHDMLDGVAAIHSLAEKYHWKIQNLATTQVNKIGFVKYFYNCLMFLYWAHPRRKNIWPFKFVKTNSTTTLHVDHKFSIDETTALITKAKWLKVSLNTLLFFTLNKTISEKFKLNKDELSWWIPVNMRPDLGLDVNDASIKKNYVSNFSIDVRSNTSLSDCQSLISKSLKQQKHWATWWWQNLGRFVPESTVEFIAKRNIVENYYVGAFSNLGTWSCSEENSNLNFFVNPLLSHPIGAGAIIWNGRLNITLRAYPTFPVGQDDLEELIQNWVTKL